MITNNGKDIIAKYLIGQAPAYASFIALGAGPRPLQSTESLADYSEKTELDFEMFRVQITSRGYVTDIVNGQPVSKVVFTAELPTEQRYEITEIGVYSAKNNPSALGRDGRIIYTFTEVENWEYHNENLAVGLGQVITAPLFGESNDGIMNAAPQDLSDPENPVWLPFVMSSNNAILNSESRISKYERPRFLSAATLVPGDLSYLEPVTENATTEFVVKSSEDFYFGRHIHLEGITLDLSQNSPEDELKLAFSVMNRDEGYNSEPSKVMILAEFASDESANPSYAKFQAEVIGIATNRYRVVTRKLKDLIKSNAFTWKAVGVVKIYVTVMESAEIDSVMVSSNIATISTKTPHGKKIGEAVTVKGVGEPFDGTYKVESVPTASSFTFDLTADDQSETTITDPQAVAEGPSSNFYVALDGMRFENTSSRNPLYGLTGYSEVRTFDAQPVIKEPNTSNLVEFRFGLDVV
jgi:hypothetical protein